MLNALRNARILLIGGTGFVGSAIRDWFDDVNGTHNLGACLYITTRRVSRVTRSGDFAYFVPADYPYDQLRHITHIVHLAHGVTIPFNLARSLGVPLLYASSGAAAKLQTKYAEEKRAAEMDCRIAIEAGCNVRAARLWTFIGPRLPLDTGYAAGNFIRDALRGGPIVVKGDGKAVRSWMYTSDLAEWMWTILLCGRGGEFYDVGSNEAMTVARLANAVASVYSPRLDVQIIGDPAVPSTRYVPNTDRTRNALGLEQKVDLRQAIAKTIAWNVARGNNENR